MTHSLRAIRFVWPWLFPLAACAGAAAPAGAPRLPASPLSLSARRLAGDTTLTTPSGAVVIAPGGWWLSRDGAVIRLEDPDRALTATLVESPEPDALAAIAAAWRRARPGFALAPKGAPERPPPDGGWDAVTNVAYAAPIAQRRAASATARRFGATTYVALVDGDSAAVARRGAQLGTALGTLRPPGMRDESFAGTPPRTLDGAAARALDAFIAGALGRMDVPGAAVAVAMDGRVIYEQAFGVRALGRPEPVTAATLFMIGSITKPMTTLMQATLVDAGAFAWDTPVTRVLPGFALGDPAVTARVTMWHTACACSGMPQQDLESIFQFEGVTPEQRIAAMKTMTPTTGFGETFQYSNLMVAAGGYAAAHAYAPALPLGDAYAAAMQRKVFDPIGMTSTTLDFAAALRADHACPHALAIDGAARAIPPAMERAVLAISPAGAIWTNLRDMERFALTELGNGVAPGGGRVVSQANLLERHKQRVRSGAHAGADDGYGLGLDVGTFHGLPAVWHTGGLFGFGTLMFLLPAQRIAIIVLTNVRNGGGYEQLPFNAAVKRRIVEALFPGAKDRAAAMVDFFITAKRNAAAAALERLGRRPAPGWSRGLTGAYANDSLGPVRIDAAPEGGTFDAGEWKSRFAPSLEDDGAVKLVLIDPPFAGGEIVVGGDEARRTLIIQYMQMRYVFERAP